MTSPCIVTMDLHRYLAEQERLDSVLDALDSITKEVTEDLLHYNEVRIGSQRWAFDDVLSVAFETEEFCDICKALAQSTTEPERFLAQRTRYQYMIEAAAEALASTLAERIFHLRKHGGYYHD
ncbi:hypothetical protein [Vibrio penaeicida]|uniref:DUF3630 family protein n=1 Tax=Vibrio penaeicida TaxID=104609 RepID=A0AAV5NSB0_9VIBR|nr:hypothetical protein [Vibrio penaeicida]RTZ24288.1 hypothetical protein EKN09_04430 [Vibrio penaeicida]GLQ72886.1 hypothetical protein GCM10007932_22460 [Vibrio penaeicida]